MYFRFENGILFAREVFSSNAAFANENLLAMNVFPHRDTKPSQIFLGWLHYYFSTRASATTVSTCGITLVLYNLTKLIL